MDIQQQHDGINEMKEKYMHKIIHNIINQRITNVYNKKLEYYIRQKESKMQSTIYYK